ncbi:hypothetical protein J7K93_13715 [bacterium]|nr:hypothetical protein [bacterium]
MRKLLFFYLLFFIVIAIFIQSCNLNQVLDLPQRVKIIANASETSADEVGIDAVPEKNAILVQWRCNDDKMTISYRVYRSKTKKGKYAVVTVVPDTFVIDEAVLLNQRYYYYVTGISGNGSEGPQSDTLDYKLLQKAVCVEPNGSVSAVPEFKWLDPNEENINFLRVIDSGTGDYIWTFRMIYNYSGAWTLAFNVDGSASVDSLIKGKEYLWRVDVIGSGSNSGSESAWTLFRIE